MFLTLAGNIFQAIAPLIYVLLLAVLFLARIEFKTVPSNSRVLRPTYAGRILCQKDLGSQMV